MKLTINETTIRLNNDKVFTIRLSGDIKDRVYIRNCSNDTGFYAKNESIGMKLIRMHETK